MLEERQARNEPGGGGIRSAGRTEVSLRARGGIALLPQVVPWHLWVLQILARRDVHHQNIQFHVDSSWCECFLLIIFCLIFFILIFLLFILLVRLNSNWKQQKKTFKRTFIVNVVVFETIKYLRKLVVFKHFKNCYLSINFQLL